MALDTYAALQTAIAAAVNRADLTANIPDFITSLEGIMTARFMADSPPRQMMGRSDATINAEFITVPTDFLSARAFYLSANYLPLDYIDPEEIVKRKTLYPHVSGDPQCFAVVGAQFQFWPWNASTFTGELTYWKTIPALSNTNTSNWLLALNASAYLYGCVMLAYLHLKDEDRAAVHRSAFEAVMNDIIMAGKVGKEAPHLSVGIVAGGTP